MLSTTVNISALKIIGHDICPYVQRVIIVAELAGMHIIKENIDLQNKPSWLVNLNPSGKVPIAILSDDTVLFESTVICEYIAELSNLPIHPKNPKTKALHRSWICHAEGILALIARLIYVETSEQGYQKTVKKMYTQLAIAERFLKNRTDLNMNNIRMIHVVYAILCRKLEVFENTIDFSFTSAFPFLASLWQSTQNLDAVKNAVPQNFSQRFIKLIRNETTYLSARLHHERLT